MIVATSGMNKGVCTGFVIAQDRVLTDAHCLLDGNIYADGNLATVLKSDPYYDLMELEVRTNRSPLIFRDAKVVKYEPLVGIGYGFGWNMLSTVNLTPFLIDFWPNPAMPPGLFMQGELIHGMSGGPIIDSNGEVVAICQQENEGSSYGIGTQLIKAFLLGVK